MVGNEAYTPQSYTASRQDQAGNAAFALIVGNEAEALRSRQDLSGITSLLPIFYTLQRKKSCLGLRDLVSTQTLHFLSPGFIIVT